MPEVSPARPGPAGTGGPGGPAADTPADAGGDTPAGTPAAGGCADRTAPIARISRVTRLRLSGTASDSGCNARVRRVAVSVARVSGKRCRFLRASGGFGPPVACSRATALTASGTTRWSLRIRRRLPRGTYRVTVRAIDAVGNTGRSVQVARHL